MVMSTGRRVYDAGTWLGLCSLPRVRRAHLQTAAGGDDVL